MNMSTPEIEELKKYIQEKFGKQLKTTTDFFDDITAFQLAEDEAPAS